jgi:putative aldouronate transport system permease protein
MAIDKSLASNLKRKGKGKEIWKNRILFFMLLPGLIYMIINNYLPLYGLSIAFRNINFKAGIFNSPFADPLWKNFQFLFKTKDAWVMTRNTILYNVVFILLGTFLSVVFALMINEIRKAHFKKVYQTAILLPNLISYVVVAYLVYAFLSTKTGFINNTILPMLGIDPISWYTKPSYWTVIIPIVNSWKTAGYSSVVYLAAIVGIDTDYYEAADLDGASRLRQIWHITLPLISPTIITLTLLSIGRIFYSDFGLFYQVPMNAGVLYSTTQTIDTYVYRGLLQLGDIGMSSAAGFYQSIVGFLLIVTANGIVRKFSKENALF